MNSRLQTLLKPSWSVSDISTYLGCSKSKALKIKKSVSEKYGYCKLDFNKNQKRVKGDDVIKYLGGVNRFEEMSILCKALKEE